jgi:hypothetical protein
MPPSDADARRPSRQPQADRRRQDPSPRGLYSLKPCLRVGRSFRLADCRAPGLTVWGSASVDIGPDRTHFGFGATDRGRRFAQRPVADAGSAAPTDLTPLQACLHQAGELARCCASPCCWCVIARKMLAGSPPPRRPLSPIPFFDAVAVWNSRAHQHSPYQPISSVAFQVIRSVAVRLRALAFGARQSQPDVPQPGSRPTTYYSVSRANTTTLLR